MSNPEIQLNDQEVALFDEIVRSRDIYMDIFYREHTILGLKKYEPKKLAEILNNIRKLSNDENLSPTIIATTFDINFKELAQKYPNDFAAWLAETVKPKKNAALTMEMLIKHMSKGSLKNGKKGKADKAENVNEEHQLIKYFIQIIETPNCVDDLYNQWGVSLFPEIGRQMGYISKKTSKTSKNSDAATPADPESEQAGQGGGGKPKQQKE